MLDFAALNKQLDEEYEGVIEYAKLCKETGEGIFRDMAREEMTHAKHLEWYINKNGKLTDHEANKSKAKAALEEV